MTSADAPMEIRPRGVDYDPVIITRIVRRMRGGSQAYLVEGQNSDFYVAKFAINPLGNRHLINDWIVHHLMVWLEICTPKVRVLHLPESVREVQELYFTVGDRKAATTGDLHFGSQCPVNPQSTAIFDFLPTPLLKQVVNLSDFATAFVLDKWLHHTDQRKAVFVRESSASTRCGYRAYFLSSGMALDGSSEQFTAARGLGFSMDLNVYRLLQMPDLCEKALLRIEKVTGQRIHAALEAIPACWFEHADRTRFEDVFSLLQKQRLGLHSRLERDLEIFKRETTGSDFLTTFGAVSGSTARS